MLDARHGVPKERGNPGEEIRDLVSDGVVGSDARPGVVVDRVGTRVGGGRGRHTAVQPSSTAPMPRPLATAFLTFALSTDIAAAAHIKCQSPVAREQPRWKFARDLPAR